MFGSRSPHTQAVPQDESPSRFSWGVLILAVILLIQGCILVWAGWDAIAQRYYEITWKSRSTFGSSHGVSVYADDDAVLQGIGLACGGCMLFVWGTGLAAGFFDCRPSGLGSKFKRLLGWVSFGALVAGCICVYPPWQLASLSFYAVIVVMFVVIPLGSRPGFPSLAKYVLPCLIGASVAANTVSPGVAVGMILGIFVSFALLVHLTMLTPKLGVPID